MNKQTRLGIEVVALGQSLSHDSRAIGSAQRSLRRDSGTDQRRSQNKKARHCWRAFEFRTQGEQVRHIFFFAQCNAVCQAVFRADSYMQFSVSARTVRDDAMAS